MSHGARHAVAVRTPQSRVLLDREDHRTPQMRVLLDREDHRTRQTRVLIYSQDHRMSQQLVEAVSSRLEADVVSKTGDVSQLVEVFAEERLDMAVMVLAPGFREFEYVRALKANYPIVTMIVLSDHPSEAEHSKWQQAGVDFYFGAAEAVDVLPDLV